MRIVIGIISYFPDNQRIRKERVKMLQALINQCDKLFDLPVLIVAQNWQNDSVNGKDLTVKHYSKLGITGARKELIRLFLEETDYDYLIMLDDDCIIVGSYIDAKKYLYRIKVNPNGYGIKRGTLLKLAAFSRYILGRVDFPDISPEQNEGYEDCIFIMTARSRYPNKEFFFSDGLRELSNSKDDPLSVWRNECKNTIDLKALLENTRAMVRSLS